MIGGRPLKRKNGALTSAVLEEDLGMSDLESVAFSSDGLHLKAFHYLILNTDTVFLEFFDLAFSDSISLQVKF